MTIEITPTNIDGEDYFTVNEFATLVKKTPQTIYHAARNGKGDNNLKSVNKFNKVFILASEYERYCLTGSILEEVPEAQDEDSKV